MDIGLLVFLNEVSAEVDSGTMFLRLNFLVWGLPKDIKILSSFGQKNQERTCYSWPVKSICYLNVFRPSCVNVLTMRGKYELSYQGGFFL